MKTKELGKMDAEMNVEQEVLKEQGHQLNAAENPRQVKQQHESNAVSNCEPDERGDGRKVSATEQLGSTLDKSEVGAELAADHVGIILSDVEELAGSPNISMPKLVQMPANIEENMEVVMSSAKNLSTTLASSVALPTDPGDCLSARDSSESSELPSMSSFPISDELLPTVSSPSKERSKKGRSWKKTGRKDRVDKDFQSETRASFDSESNLDPEESPRDSYGPDPGPNATPYPSELPQLRGTEDLETELTRSFDEIHREASPESSVTRVGHEEVPLPQETKSDAASSSVLISKTGRSSGRWADIIEESDRAKDTELERSRVGETSVNMRSIHKDPEIREKAHDINELGPPAFRDLRGKGQQSSDAASPASRESNWRRRPAESVGRLDVPYTPSRSVYDRETRKDEQQDFRPRMQHGAEPQATHKNWIPRRGVHRSEGEGRVDQNKMRGKGKQGRDIGVQNPATKDIARQKFEADRKIKQDELLQKSKLSLAEFFKAKRIEQVRKGRDDLEAELNRNLLYEAGELYFLNMNP